MPRTARAAVGGICYHVINRGNGRARVFRDDADTFGAQSPTLVFTRAQAADAGSYDCVVKLNDCTRSTSNAAGLVVYAAGSADGNGDGAVNGRDVQAFVEALVNHGPVSAASCAYELTGEGVVDLGDVEAFVSRLLAA
jgi:hypothetical protein